MARKTGKIWREHGALEYIECVADDVTPGRLTWFPQAIKSRQHGSSISVALKDGEVMVLSWIAYASRRGHDRINKLEMAGAASPP
jgi:uncharacterized protein YbaA (DUF1428 family)